MKTEFLTSAETGKNHWWRYLLTIVSIVLGFFVTNIIIRTFINDLRDKYEGDPLAKDLLMYSLVGGVFLFVLFVFRLSFQKIHKRKFSSLISIDQKFSIANFLFGFLIFAVLIFISSLITDQNQFVNFQQNFELKSFLLLFSVGSISIGIQSFFEEIVIRAYFLQGLSLKIKRVGVLIVLNSLLFGLLHFGYGIESFVASWLFGISFTIVVLIQGRIEYVSGAHLANNLVLAIFFVDLKEATNENFSWSFDFLEIGIHILVMILFIAISYFLTKKNVVK
jgi:membrane protease YdiL (CAAX protease family)